VTDEEARRRLNEILKSTAYRLATEDPDLLNLEEMRPLRLQLEFFKPEHAFRAAGIDSTIVVFGGTQVLERDHATERKKRARNQREREVAERILAKSHYYDEARAFAGLAAGAGLTVITGGGPGIMEAANRGAFEAGKPSAGLNISLPEEQGPNSYVTPGLCFQFQYFALRKMHFLLRAVALVCFPGGFGTLDELFDALTLRQTERMQPIPIVLFGREFWDRVIDFRFLADEGVIKDEHLELLEYAESATEAWSIVERSLPPGGFESPRPFLSVSSVSPW
jgi:uncharacterized protein (TIGR00730 family)